MLFLALSVMYLYGNDVCGVKTKSITAGQAEKYA